MSIEFFDLAQAQTAIKADAVCKAIGTALQKSYPRRQWYVDVSISGGTANIMCPSISTRHAYVLHINKTAEQLQKDTIKAGGQILEMFKLSRERSAGGGEEFLLRDARGEAIHAATGL
jgi:hypothetical protein